MWSLTGSTEALEPPNTPYGPYPCKAITKIYWNQDTDGDTWTVFRDDLSLRQERISYRYQLVQLYGVIRGR